MVLSHSLLDQEEMDVERKDMAEKEVAVPIQRILLKVT